MGDSALIVGGALMHLGCAVTVIGFLRHRDYYSYGSITGRFHDKSGIGAYLVETPTNYMFRSPHELIYLGINPKGTRHNKFIIS